MRHRIRHRTTYTYDDDVIDSLGVAYVRPRELSWQRVESIHVKIDPVPSDQSLDVDHLGNAVDHFQVLTPHRRLDVTAHSQVQVDRPDHAADLLSAPWVDVRPLVDPTLAGGWQATDFALASPLVDQTEEVRDYASQSFDRHVGVADVADDLTHRLYRDFAYRPGATTVTSTIAEVMKSRAGVCQDFAHVLLACLRSHGLAARYVSGYLATEPPPGKDRVLGADATHAWVAVWLGGDEWLAVDPTNEQRVGERYVTVAWGRDYGDVPPLKGVIFTEATRSELAVEVDVTPA